MFGTVEVITLAAAVVVGILFGAFYFGGLWWTVRRMPRVRHPLNLYFASLVARLAVVLAAFYGVLMLGGWPLLMASIAGLVASRMVLIRFLGHAGSTEIPQQEAI